MTSFRDIAEKMDSVVTPSGLNELINLHRWWGHPETDIRYEERSFRAIGNRHDNPRKLERKFLCLNTYLMDVWIGGDAKKPAVDDRAPAIGRMIRDNFDIALLAEVFEDNVKNKILSAWPEGGRPYVVEDSEWGTGQSSGLVIISQQDQLDGKQFHEYEFESGLDRLADKGVLLTRADYGFGNSKLEFYNTHLNAGKDEARKFQVLELMSFIERTHDENNIAILAGDFNIDAFGEKRYTTNPYAIISGGGGRGSGSDSFNPRFAGHVTERLASGDYPQGISEYEVLIELLNLLGFKDIWVERNGTPGYTSNMDKRIVADQICIPDVDNSQLCDDFKVPKTHKDFHSNDVSDRIDFVFISNPMESHTFSLDFVRPRRVRHERRPDALKQDEIAFLSDHLGLTTTFILSPN